MQSIVYRHRIPNSVRLHKWPSLEVALPNMLMAIKWPSSLVPLLISPSQSLLSKQLLVCNTISTLKPALSAFPRNRSVSTFPIASWLNFITLATFECRALTEAQWALPVRSKVGNDW